MNRTESAILKTLAYADVFDYPLTKAQLWRFWLQTATRWSVFDSTLAQLVKDKRVYCSQDYYCLHDRQETLKYRAEREKIAKQKLPRAKMIATLLSLVPSVAMVGLSGALAMRNAPATDDIDLFIISFPGQMWLTRMVTVILLDLVHIRRRPDEVKIRDKICLNMYLDGSRLALPKHEQDLYSAHEIAQVVPLVNRQQTYERFLAANTWVKHYLPHILFPSPDTINPRWQKVKGGWVKLEQLSERVQRKYMRPPRGDEAIGKHILRFHPDDARARVLPSFKQKLSTLGL